jgi:hypothetical protein
VNGRFEGCMKGILMLPQRFTQSPVANYSNLRLFKLDKREGFLKKDEMGEAMINY